jgi:ribose 5-phosphate isomerase B
MGGKSMKIVIGSDHGGFELKNQIVHYLKENNIEVTDKGTDSLASVDYPDYAEKVGLAVLNEPYDFGILICGTGIGISIAANKIPGIRAALVYDEQTAMLAKAHNNANIIALGGRTTSFKSAQLIIEAFIKATYEPRHQKRIDKISTIEGKMKDE